MGLADGAPPSATHGHAVVDTAAARAAEARPPSRASPTVPPATGGGAGKGAGGEGRGVGSVGAAPTHPVVVAAAVFAARPPPGKGPTPAASKARARAAGVCRGARLATPGPSDAAAPRRVTGPVGAPRDAARRGVADAAAVVASGRATCAAAVVAAATAADTRAAAGGAGAATSAAPRAATTGDRLPGGTGIDEEATATAVARPSSISMPTAAVAAAASADRAGRGRTGWCRRLFLAAGGRPDGEPGDGPAPASAVVAARAAAVGSKVAPDAGLGGSGAVPAAAEAVLAVAVSAAGAAEVVELSAARDAGATTGADPSPGTRGSRRGVPEVAPTHGRREVDAGAAVGGTVSPPPAALAVGSAVTAPTVGPRSPPTPLEQRGAPVRSPPRPRWDREGVGPPRGWQWTLPYYPPPTNFGPSGRRRSPYPRRGPPLGRPQQPPVQQQRATRRALNPSRRPLMMHRRPPLLPTRAVPEAHASHWGQPGRGWVGDPPCPPKLPPCRPRVEPRRQKRRTSASARLATAQRAPRTRQAQLWWSLGAGRAGAGANLGRRGWAGSARPLPQPR